jgi:hypothetical protein
MQANIRTLIALISFSFLFVLSCKKEINSVDFHYDYFDLRQGRYVTYDVIEIRHDDGAIIAHDTMVYQLKTLIGDTVIDNEGRIARKFLRYTRNSVSENWVLSDVWTTIIVDRRAELVEENQRMVKMVFAPTISKVWDLNAYNSQGELECYYRNIHDEAIINGLSFDSTLVVEQEDFPSFVDYRRKYEVYANGIGLVYKYYKDLKIQNFDTLDVTSGDELFYKVTGYGFE